MDEEVKKLIDDLIATNLLWLKNCEEGSEEYKRVLSDVTTLHRMRMDEIRSINETEINRLRIELDEMRLKNNLEVEEIRAKSNIESGRNRTDNKSGQYKSDVFKSIVGFASDILKCICSVKLSDQILRYEEGGIIRSKAFPLAQNLFKMK